MKKAMMMCVAAGCMACLAGVGTIPARYVAREVVKEAAAAGAKSAATKGMSSALSKVGAKKLMAAGVGAGTAVALPMAAYGATDGMREESKARGEAIRLVASSSADAVSRHPELASSVLAQASSAGESGLMKTLQEMSGLLRVAAWIFGIGVLIAVVRFVLGSVLRLGR